MSDYISREAMLEKAEYDGNYRLVVPVEAIKGLPAADVEPVRMGSGNGALKIGGSRLRVTNVLRAGLSITGQESAAFITAPAAARRWMQKAATGMSLGADVICKDSDRKWNLASCTRPSKNW